MRPFGGNNPSSMTLSMNGVPLPQVSKVKYLEVSFLCNTGKTDMSDTIRMFYSQFNNMMSVLGKGSQEMNAVHLMTTYCLPTLTYGIENSAFCDNTTHKIQEIWNNCFRHIFSCCLCKCPRAVVRAKLLAFLSGTLHILLFLSAYCANK